MKRDGLYEIFPLGDSALTIDLGNRICRQLNQKVLAMQEWLWHHSFEGMRDIVIGYSSLSILYDPFLIQKKNKLSSSAFDFLKGKLEEAFFSAIENLSAQEHEIDIPVCYDQMFGHDLGSIAEHAKLTIDDIIRLHCSRTYRIFMIGFLPGFAYMGEVDERIAMPRKANPAAVVAGSVGGANRQTGIYPPYSPRG